jgi:hypothetical protein
MISALFFRDQQNFLKLPTKTFKVCQLIKGKTDKYSFITFEKNRYSTKPQFVACEVWIEITAKYIRVLDEKYVEIAIHERKYEKLESPLIDWLSYLPAIVRKPNAFRYTEFFKTLPDIWQNYFNKSDYEKSKQMLSALAPLIMSGNIADATCAIELTLENGTDDHDSFLACYRSLTEPVIHILDFVTPNTPAQVAYVQDFSAYEGLMDMHVARCS